MELVKKLLYGVLGILALLSLFILVCAFRPGLADKVSDLIYAGRNEERTGLNSAVGEGDNGLGTTVGEQNPIGSTAGNAGGAAGGNAVGGTTPQSTGLTSQELLRTPEPPAGYSVHTGSNDTSDRAADTVSKWDKYNVPEGVTGRGGYEPIEGQSEQLDDEAVKKLQEEYTYGETGEGLDFDTQFYPYYGMLDADGQALYRQIYANANAVNGIFNPVVKVPQGKLRNVFMAVFNDHPELFWLDSSYRGRFDRSGNCVEIVLQFNHLIDNLDAAKSEFYAAAEEILVGADQQTSDYGVELYIHDSLMNRITYDLRAPLNQSAYSALVNDRTVCAGYARAFQYLMTQMGIPCYYCTGYAGENHAWNIVKLDNEYYNADVTWDDTEPNTYNYFNKTDGEFYYTHTREDLSVKLPACNGTKYGGLESNPSAGTDVVYAGARTLEETGFTEEQILANLDSYYDDCYRQLITNGGSCQFQNVVRSESLWMECYDAYISDAYSAGYMDQVLTDLGMQGCEIDVEAEPLRDGRFVLHHTINFF